MLEFRGPFAYAHKEIFELFKCTRLMELHTLSSLGTPVKFLSFYTLAKGIINFVKMVQRSDPIKYLYS